MPNKDPKQPDHSPFALQVRAVVAAIPVGQTRTYQEVAALAGRPRAARAVGSVMAKNFDPEIPCHRVIRSDGSLGAYNRGGPTQKRALLLQEGVVL